MRIKTKIIAHRGLTSHYPENTLIAFEAAIKAGSHGIELDLHESKDGELVVHHDYMLGNPDTGTGLVRERSSQYIKSVNIQSFGHTEKIPFFEEVIKLLGNSCTYEIEMKGATIGFIQHVLALIEKYKLSNMVEYTSPHLYVLTQIKKTFPNAKVGLFLAPFPEWMNVELGALLIIDNAKLGGIDVLHCPLSILTQKSVRQFKSNGLLVHAADCNSEKDIKMALNLGVDQLSTNDPLLALELCRLQ